MKATQAIEALALNVTLLGLLFWVNGEQAARLAYAAGKGISFVYSRSLFTYTTSLKGSLTSPTTLDWTQVIVFVLVILDIYYLYGIFKSKPAKV